jgi:hypothetical protein
MSSQKLKASGTAADDITEKELISISIDLFTHSSSSAPTQVAKDFRDRSIILTSIFYAYRGDNLRSVQWSDLYVQELGIPGAEGEKLKLLCIYSDNGKTNKEGRVDEVGALRSKDARNCAIGALAMHFFIQFHVLKRTIPDFEPHFDSTSFGEWGERPWYGLLVYKGKDDYLSMSYGSEYYP